MWAKRPCALPYCIPTSHSAYKVGVREPEKHRRIGSRQLERVFPDVKPCGEPQYYVKTKSIVDKSKKLLRKYKELQVTMELRGDTLDS